MKLQDYFPYKADAEKKKLLSKLQLFIHSTTEEVFVLTGYAGTGKTTVLKSVVDYLKNEKRDVVLMASTGRAAKILRDKTLFEASTIHLGIYSFDFEQNRGGYIRLIFKVGVNYSPKNTIYIIDEASMISNRVSKASFADYGSGALLRDIFRYTDGRKIIFVGDGAQLPPVNSNISPALDVDYLKKHFATNIDSFRLKNIQRQEENTALLDLVRSFLRSFNRINFGRLNYHTATYGNSICKFNSEYELIRDYCANINLKKEPQRIIIALSNKKVHGINLLVRDIIFNSPKLLNRNEQLMCYSNNYKYGILNGESLRLLDGGLGEERRAGLNFIKCKLSVNRFGKDFEFEAFIIKEHLISPKAGLDMEQERSLMIDFSMRMKQKGIHSSDKQMWIEGLKNDPYLNALRLRYGYALTCHKSQGGEWDSVYLIFEPYFGKFDEEYQHRWAYTAVTRTRKQLILVNNIFLK